MTAFLIRLVAKCCLCLDCAGSLELVLDHHIQPACRKNVQTFCGKQAAHWLNIALPVKKYYHANLQAGPNSYLSSEGGHSQD